VNKNLELKIYNDASELILGATTQAMESIKGRLLEKGKFHIALTGGALGTEFASKLVELINDAGDLEGLNIWFSDERFDVSSSPLRNSRPVHDGLRNPTVTVHEVKSSDEGVSVQEAADLYDGELRDVVMDICVLGLGPDGHVASLFPNHWDKGSRGKAIAILDSPKPPSQRVSFSLPFINSSAQVWIIAAGVAKALAAQQVVQADTSVPAGHVRASQVTRLILDSAAFSKG
jgi:6-phosphogluconolactonase